MENDQFSDRKKEYLYHFCTDFGVTVIPLLNTHSETDTWSLLKTNFLLKSANFFVCFVFQCTQREHVQNQNRRRSALKAYSFFKLRIAALVLLLFLSYHSA